MKTRGWDSEEAFPVSLYDLEADVSEQNNIAGQNPEIVQKLSKLIEEMNLENKR